MLANFKRDFKTLYHLVKPVQGDSLKERLENFYSGQAEDYDLFRKRLLKGREELIEQLPLDEVSSWCDLGAGTGQNLDFAKHSDLIKLKTISLVDLSPSLLAQAKKRVERLHLNNVECVEADVTQWTPHEKFDVVTFSYSLTMIPDWFLALENVLDNVLKPGGLIGVVDFYVARKFDQVHNWPERAFWPLWFSFDNVFLNADHVPFLKNHFTEVKFKTGKNRLPYLPLPAPYYSFVGRSTN